MSRMERVIVEITIVKNCNKMGLHFLGVKGTEYPSILNKIKPIERCRDRTNLFVLILPGVDSIKLMKTVKLQEKLHFF